MHYAVSEDYMLKMIAVNTASNYVTAYIDTNITINNNALYNPALSPSLSGISSQFTNPRIFTKYKDIVMFISDANKLCVARFYNSQLNVTKTNINGTTIVTPISGGFGNN